MYQRAGDKNATRFLIIINVTSDDAFHTYNSAGSNSDLALFRGQAVTCTFVESPLLEHGSSDAEAVPRPLLSTCQVTQAFLPKFHTRAQDKVDVASVIRDEAGQRFMMVSVKHSGSLAMVSSELASSKNSVANPHAAAALLLLQAHYTRLAHHRYAPIPFKISGTLAFIKTQTHAFVRRVQPRRPSSQVSALPLHACRPGCGGVPALTAALAARRACLSFEIVTRCLGEHGQAPRGEHLVATALTACLPDATLQVSPPHPQPHFFVVRLGAPPCNGARSYILICLTLPEPPALGLLPRGGPAPVQ